MSDPANLLLILLALPTAAAVLVAALGPHRGALIRWISLATALATLALAVHVTWVFAAPRLAPDFVADQPVPTFRPELVTSVNLLQIPGTDEDPDAPGLQTTAIRFFVGLDGLNVWLILLTAVLFLPSVLVSWKAVTERVNEFYAWLLALQSAMIGIFLAFDIVLFYVFFELSLVPLFFLIGIWGGSQRQHAARKFFIYTLVGSLITLLGVFGIVLATHHKTGILTFSIPDLVTLVHRHLPEDLEYWRHVQFWVFLAFMAGFAVKVPLTPFHTWLPLAHVEAPTAGSVDLAGILLKIGAYGFLRLCLPLAPDVSIALGLPLVSTMAAVGIVYGAFCAYAQDDVKRLIAYSSVSHLGLCMLGMFAMNPTGLAGSLMQMINHGLSTGALFLLIGMLYERYHTRQLKDYGGMASRLPLFAVLLVFMCLTSVGLPGLNGFVGEVLALMGVFAREYSWGRFPWFAVIGASGVILGAWYLMTMLRRLLFGPLKEPALGHDGHHPAVTDLTARELLLIAPIAVLCVVLGVYPQPVLQTAQPDLDIVAHIARKAEERSTTVAAQAARTVPRDESVR